MESLTDLLSVIGLKKYNKLALKNETIPIDCKTSSKIFKEFHEYGVNKCIDAFLDDDWQESYQLVKSYQEWNSDGHESYHCTCDEVLGIGLVHADRYCYL